MKTKKPSKKNHLTPLEKVSFYNLIFCYFIYIEHNDDLVDPYVLDVSLIPPPVLKQSPKKRKVYHLSSVLTVKEVKRLKSKRPKLFKLVIGALVFVLLITVVQFLYPAGRSLPFAKLESHGYLGFADKQKILETFTDFDQRIVTIHTHTKSITTSYKDLGITIDPDATVSKMTDYPVAKRLIPFSIFFVGNKNYQISRDINEPQLSLFVTDIVALASKKPVDALVTLKDAKFSISASEEGYEYQLSALKSVVLRADLSDNAQLVFTPTILYPNIASDLAGTNSGRMQQRINNSLVVNANGKSITFDTQTLASWVEILHKPDQKTVDIIFNQSRIADSLRDFPAKVDYPANSAVTTMLNGNRVGRTEGSVGKTLQFEQLVKQIADTTSPATSSVEASVTTILPPEVIERKYSKDSSGVQSLLDYWTATNGGQYGIDFRTINGRISANVNSNRLFSSVGIYRVYIASLIYGRLSGGSISSGTITQTGHTVDTCLSKMIIESNEACTNALGDIVGWGASDQMLINQGFESTTLTQGASLTTANDTSDWLIKLLSGNITTFSQANSLTNLMSNQIYRQGMPAGSYGIRVADKSGAFGRGTNDIGVVYNRGGNYVLSILSEGSSLSKIAELTKEINKVMNQ